MHEGDVVAYLNKAVYLVFVLSLPTILVASLVGTLFSLLQALTQIQEQTLSFGVKLIAVGITLFLTAGWMGGEIYRFTLMLFELFPGAH